MHGDVHGNVNIRSCAAASLHFLRENDYAESKSHDKTLRQNSSLFAGGEQIEMTSLLAQVARGFLANPAMIVMICSLTISDIN